MKLCPNCKATLDDNARFCLQCMTSLEEKEQIQPPVRKVRRWPLVLLCSLLLGSLLIVILIPKSPASDNPPDPTLPGISSDPTALSCTVDGVRYSFRPATEEDHPTATVAFGNYYVLTRVEGTPADGIYRVPSFVGEDTGAPVTVVADGAFAGTNARVIDLGHNVRFVWGNAFDGCPLTDLHLHEDVRIEKSTLSGSDANLTIHCPDYLENTEGLFWSDLAEAYGFRWQSEIF